MQRRPAPIPTYYKAKPDFRPYHLFTMASIAAMVDRFVASAKHLGDAQDDLVNDWHKFIDEALTSNVRTVITIMTMHYERWLSLRSGKP
jgi:hypothetical protein